MIARGIAWGVATVRDRRSVRAHGRIAAAALALSLHVGCGGAAAYEHETGDVEPELERPSELLAEQTEAEAALSEVLAAVEPDCARACELGVTMCDLRDRICGIAERHPNDEQSAGYCEDAEARCARADARVRERCTCEPR